MAEQFAGFLKEFFNSDSFIVELLIIFIVSMMPILELRGGIVAAAFLGVNPWIALPVCIIGNMLPIPFELLFIRKIFSWLRRFPKIGAFVDKLEARAKEKGKKIETYKAWGLFTFVAIPLPGTGAWTGSLIASLFALPKKSSFLAVLLGVLGAGVIMCLASYGVVGFLKIFL